MARRRNRREMPARIDDIHENIEAAVLSRSPKDDWAYMEGHAETPQPAD